MLCSKRTGDSDTQGTTGGLGRHLQAFDLFAAVLTYTDIMIFVEFSILALQYRVFSNSKNLNALFAVLDTAAVMWGTTVVRLGQNHRAIGNVGNSKVLGLVPFSVLPTRKLHMSPCQGGWCCIQSSLVG